MLGGFILSAIGSGLVSLCISALAGHPPLVALGLYCLAGSCGVLANALHNVLVHDAMMSRESLSL